MTCQTGPGRLCHWTGESTAVVGIRYTLSGTDGARTDRLHASPRLTSAYIDDWRVGSRGGENAVSRDGENAMLFVD